MPGWSSVLLWGLLLCSPLLGQATVSVTNSEYARLAETLHSFPHFSFWHFHDSADVMFNTNQDYIESMGILAAPFVGFGIAFLCFGIMFCTCRFMNHCGGRRARQGGYTGCERNAPRLFLIAFILAVLAFCGAGIWGSVHFDQALPGVLDRIEDTGNLVVTRAGDVLLDILQLQEFISNTYELPDIVDDAKKISTEISEHRSDIDTAEMTRNIVVIALFGAIVLACGVGLLAAVFSLGIPSLWMVVSYWSICVFLWMVCGAHLSASVAVGDLCETVDEYLFDEFFSSDNVASIVPHYLFCNKTPLLQNLVAEVNNLTKMANEELQQAQQSGNQTAIAFWSRVVNQSELLTTDINVLLDCNTTSKNYHDIKETVCTDIILGVFVITVAQFFVGALGLVIFVLGMVGYKRFPRPQGYIELGDEFGLSEKEQALFPNMEAITLNSSRPDRRASVFM